MEKFYFTKDKKTLVCIDAKNIHDAQKQLPAGTWEWVAFTGDVHSKSKATKKA